MHKLLVLFYFIYYINGSQKYVSCGTDDEEEGKRCCVTKYIDYSSSFCANSDSNDPSKQCLPELCKKDVWIKENNQTSCLDKFLDGSPGDKGSCAVVYKSRCKCFI